AGHGVDIYVVDTGVRVDHVDFGGRAQWGVTTRTGSPDEDDNGHGSHVAGTAAGLVSGVAKRANVIAVKVLDAAGHGPYSELIEGLAWVANRTRTTGRPSIVNLSIQGRPSNVLNRALAGLTRLGIHVTSAAGNMGADACRYSPASATREASAGGGGGGGAAIVSVGATDGRDALAGFSNYGECVSVYAPGVDVASVFADSVNQYVELSGTSMASPLVAGAVAVLLSEQRGRRRRRGGGRHADADEAAAAAVGRVPRHCAEGRGRRQRGRRRGRRGGFGGGRRRRRSAAGRADRVSRAVKIFCGAVEAMGNTLPFSS
ncbi:peptidase S8/S53 domain-containing protein, partial [Zopfochytrium polystomum]